MWNAFVHRRNGGGYDDVSSLQFIELTDEDCELLIAAGLKIEKGASPRDLYCFQNLPYYDGTPLQVLRLLEEARSAGRNARKDDVEPVEAFEIQGNKRQRVEGAYSGASGLLSNLTLWSQPKKDLSIDLELLDDGDDFVEVIRVSSSKLPPSPVKNTRAAAAAKVSSPVQASLATLPAIFRSGSNTMAIDTSSAHEEIFTPSSSTRKRKSEARSTSPLAALFSPRTSIRTPSPGLKTRRSSVLKEFETPEQPTGSETPQTVPAKSKRVSVTPPQYTKTTFELSECEDENDEANDGLVDDSPEDDERACCDVRSVVEPIWEALQRTSSMLQNAWEEYSKVTPNPIKATATKTN